jgi:predicted RNA binding protein YcfA (HicA-like mRNA interferase family)
MTNFPSLTGDEIIRTLLKAGFQKVSQRGSHVKMAHPNGKNTVVPVHKGESIGIGLMRKILKDAGFTKQQFLKLIGD